MIVYWENWKGLCQKEGKNYMLWSHLVVYPPFKLQDLYVSTCALPYSYFLHFVTFKAQFAAVKLCPIPHLPIYWIPTHTVHNPLFLPVQLFMGSCWKLKTVECFSLKKKKCCFFVFVFFPWRYVLLLLQRSCPNSCVLEGAASCSPVQG